MTYLLAVVKCVVVRLLFLIFYSLHTPPPLACLLRSCVGCSYLLAYKASPPDDDWFLEMARLVALHYSGVSVSGPDCLCVTVRATVTTCIL